jgi:hypothetical protein
LARRQFQKKFLFFNFNLLIDFGGMSLQWITAKSRIAIYTATGMLGCLS